MKKNEGEEDGENVEATLVECRVTLDRADNKDNADNARLNITFSCDLCNNEELEALKNRHLGEVRPEEANSCLSCKRQFKCTDDLMDHIKWYHKTCAECVKHGVMCALCRREGRIWHQRT